MAENRTKITKLLEIGEPDFCTEDSRLPGLVDLCQQMGDPPPDRDAPVRKVMARLGDNWSALILKVLATGTFRHATLKRIVGALSAEGDISQRMLTLRLRELEQIGFVERFEHATVPPRVDYSLSPMGQMLVTEFDRILSWIETHAAEIQAAQDRFSG